MKNYAEYKSPPLELFCELQKQEPSLTWQRECAAKLIEYFERNKIKAELVAVSSGNIATFVFKSNAFRTIKQRLPDIEFNLALGGKIRATEKFSEYSRSISCGIEGCCESMKGDCSEPIMSVREAGFFVTLEIPMPERIVTTVGEALRETAPNRVPIGRSIDGGWQTTCLEELPHLLIGGCSGSGKSIFIHSLIAGLIYRNSPEKVRFLLIDPTGVEFEVYEELPHSLTRKLIYESVHAINALNFAVNEIERRLEVLRVAGEMSVCNYNVGEEVSSGNSKILPHIVVVIDELTYLMLTHKKSIEKLICAIARKGKTAGIHLILSSQRTSSDIFLPQFKKCIPTRIAFRVCSYIDSRIILDVGGANALVGNGDMLFSDSAVPEPKRIQGCYVSASEIENLVRFVADNNTADFDPKIEQAIFKDEQSD